MNDETSPEPITVATTNVDDRVPEHVLVPASDLKLYRMQSKALLVLAGAIAGFIIRGATAGNNETPPAQALAAQAPQGQQPQAPQGQQPQAPQAPEVDPAIVIKRLNSEALVSVIGDKNAKSTIYEFTDFQCPACKGAAEGMLLPLREQFVKTGKAKLVLVHWPLTQIHPSAPMGAKAALCSDKQGKLEQFHDALFGEQTQWSSLDTSPAAQAQVRLNLIAMAGRFGMDKAKFTECIDSSQFDKGIAKNGQLALELGAHGTPTFFFNGKKNIGSQQEAEAVLNAGIAR